MKAVNASNLLATAQPREKREDVQWRWKREEKKRWEQGGWGGGEQGKFKRLFRYNTSEQEEMDVTTRFPPPLLGQVHLLLAANAG